jgi:hypothetical protein
MQTHETACELVGRKESHKYRFSHTKDARNRKVRGLWVRDERVYAQIRVPGEKSARKIPLNVKTLTGAKEEMAKEKTKAREGALHKGGVKPSLADYAKDDLDYPPQRQEAAHSGAGENIAGTVEKGA